MKLVTAIMPARGNHGFAARALQCFLDQTYVPRRLIILDDENEPAFPDGVLRPSVGYERSASRLIAEKRNILASLINHEETDSLIVHFDSDDYSAPDRLSDQVKRLEESRKQVAGYCSMLFHETPTGRAAKYVGIPDYYALGTSLMYTRAFWLQHPFREAPDTPNVGEDNRFVKTARDAGELISVDAGQLMVARAHAGNSSPKDMNKFCPVSIEAIPQGFF